MLFVQTQAERLISCYKNRQMDDIEEDLTKASIQPSLSVSDASPILPLASHIFHDFWEPSMSFSVF